MIKKVAVFILFAVIGGVAYIFLSPYVASAIPQFTPLITPVQSTLTRIQTTWATIPSTIQAIITLAIPTAAALFFAWTKSRAMDKLQQTQQQAATQIGSLNTQMQTVEQERDTKIGELETQLAAAQDTTGLQASLTESQTLVGQKQTEIHDLQVRFQGQIDALHEQIEREKLKVHETVVVK